MFALFCSIICAWFAFFLPCFATYKVLNQRPINEAELERLAQLWVVLGAFVGVEYVGEWLVSWIPFYFELKTIFLLFISLPQTQGSTFIYQTWMQPYFSKNEQAIDNGIISLQGSILSFVQARLYMLWELLWSVLNKNPATGQPPVAGQAPPAAPSLASLWQSYGPAVLGALSAAKPAAASTPAPPTASASGVQLPTSEPRAVRSEAPPFPEPQHI